MDNNHRAAVEDQNEDHNNHQEEDDGFPGYNNEEENGEEGEEQDTASCVFHQEQTGASVAPVRPSRRATAKAQRWRIPETLPVPITIVDPAPDTINRLVIADIERSAIPVDSDRRPLGTIAMEAGLATINKFGIKSESMLGLLQVVAVFMNSNLSRSGLPDLSPTDEFGIGKFGKVLIYIADARSIQATLKTIDGIETAINSRVPEASQLEDLEEAAASKKRKSKRSGKQKMLKKQKTQAPTPAPKAASTPAATPAPAAKSIGPKPVPLAVEVVIEASTPAPNPKTRAARTAAVKPIPAAIAIASTDPKATPSAAGTGRRRHLGDVTAGSFIIRPAAKVQFDNFLQTGVCNNAVRKAIEALCGVIDGDYVLFIVPPSVEPEYVTEALSALRGEK
ncbi:hypothetical protein HDU96_000163 [Phlyctochytrium bullatum]|nr:hypothetical protein HDU96_000163 [Phlyctochytrium bullatum]